MLTQDDAANKGAFEDIWTSISNNDVDGSGHTNDLYALRKSTSLLSQKSLEVCTESLGSETGSESSPDDVAFRCKEFLTISRKLFTSSQSVVVPTSFPPPLPSLSQRNLQMRAHRQDGRLVVQAVSVPSVNRLRAFRQDGRLLLTYTQNDETTIQEQDNELGKTTSYYSTETSSCWPRNLKRLQHGDDLDSECYWQNLGLLGGPQGNNNDVGPNEEYYKNINNTSRTSSLFFWDSDNLPLGLGIAT